MSTAENIAFSTEVVETLLKRLDELDKIIKPLESQLIPFKKEQIEITEFLKKYGNGTNVDANKR